MTSTPLLYLFFNFIFPAFSKFNKTEYLVLEGEGSVDSMTLLHMAATLERKLSQKAAQEFLETLVLDKWLHEVNSGTSN